MKYACIYLRSGIVRQLSRAMLMFGMLLIPLLSGAQEWRLEPVFRAGAEYDDNARMSTRTDDVVELQGWLADVTANIVFSTERTNFEFTPRYLLRRYPDESDFDSNDLFLQAQHSYEGLKNSFGFRARFDEQQVRNAERSDADLDSDDPDEIPDDGSDRVGVGGERAKWRFEPYWERHLTPNSFFGVNIGYVDVKYSDVVGDRLRDYTDTRVKLTYRNMFSQNNTAIVEASARSYERDDSIDNEIDGFGVRVGFQRNLSQTTSLRALLGAEVTDQGILGDQAEAVGEISLRRRLETIRLLAKYSREVTASGSGQLAVRDSIMLNASRDLSEKISVAVGVRAYQSDNLTDITREVREFVQLRSRFTWNFTRTVSMFVDYRYTVLDRGNLSDESANSNQVALWFAYEPRPRDR